jgi:hypothetical protein
MPTWVTQGTHRYYYEGALLCFEASGAVYLPDINCIFAVSEEIERAHGYVLSLYNTDDSVRITPEARQRIAARAKERGKISDGATAIGGASVSTRVLIGLLRNAARLLGRRNPPLKFCNTAQEAMQWLTAEGLRLREIYQQT